MRLDQGQVVGGMGISTQRTCDVRSYFLIHLNNLLTVLKGAIFELEDEVLQGAGLNR